MIISTIKTNLSALTSTLEATWLIANSMRNEILHDSKTNIESQFSTDLLTLSDSVQSLLDDIVNHWRVILKNRP